MQYNVKEYLYSAYTFHQPEQHNTILWDCPTNTYTQESCLVIFYLWGQTTCHDQKDKGSNLGGLGWKSQIMIISYKLHAQPNMANSAIVKSKAKFDSSLA